MPVFALDFSEGNIYNQDQNIHDFKHGTNPYLQTISMIAGSYSNVTNLPIFGYGATTAAVAP